MITKAFCAFCPRCLPPALLLLLAPSALADYTVTGRFLYKDRSFDANGFTGATDLRAIRFADVRIIDGAGTALAAGATGSDGSFAIVVPGSSGQAIRAVCLASSTAHPTMRVEIRSTNSSLAYGSVHTLVSSPVTSTQLGTTIAESGVDAGKVFNMWDVVQDGMEFLATPEVNGRYPGEQLTLLWNSSLAYTVSFYGSTPQRFIFIGSKSAYDDPVVYHQFGHFAADILSKLDNPTTVPTMGDGNQDIRTAWAEGVGMFIGASIRRFKGYPRPDVYIITDNTNLLFSLEIESLTSPNTLESTQGSTNMLAVCAALWDITDGTSTDDSAPGTDDDALSRSFNDVWRVMTQYIPTLTNPGRSAEDFWDGWFSPGINNGAQGEMEAIFSGLNGIEFVKDSLEPDDGSAGAPVFQAAPFLFSSGVKVVINEVELGEIDTIELLNRGDAEVDLAGWIVEAGRAGYVTARLVLPSFTLKPGGIVVLSEASGVNSNTMLYFGTGIPWASGAEGACALRDGSGAGRDFVRWGASTEFPPGGTGFTGPNPPAPPGQKTLGRNLNGADSDNGSDWKVQTPSPRAFNISGEEKHHTFYPNGDQDCASFDAVGGRYYVIETVGLRNGADTVLDLLGTDGAAVLATSDDLGPTKGSRIYWTAPSSGRYFALVRRYAGAGNYARYGSFDFRVIESASQIAPVTAQTLTVSKAGMGGRYETISDAVSAAGNGDTVQVIDSGTYAENVTIQGKSITVRVAAGKRPVLDGRNRPSQATLVIRNLKTAAVDGLLILGGPRGMSISGATAKISNTVVVRATGATDSDGIQVAGADGIADILHCTIASNARVGIGVFDKASVRVINSIVYGNTSVDVGGDGTATSLIVKNTIVPKGGYAGKDNNIPDDPKFVNASADNYRLQSGSPAIDKGDPAEAGLPVTDADGLPRALDGDGNGSAIPDMGAYEYLAAGSLTILGVFPQIAVGGPGGAEYRTSVVGINTGAQAAIVTAGFTKSSGGELAVTAGGTTASSFDMVLPPSGTSRLETTGTSSLEAGYARLLSNVAVSGTALFKLMRGSTALSEAGVGLSKLTKRFRVYIDNLNNAYSGYAVANPGTARANLTMTLRNSSGAAIATKNVPLDAGTHFARFAAQEDQFGANAPAGFEGSIEFTSDQNVAAVALRFDNTTQDVFSTIPVLADEASTTLYFPQVADGEGYRTNFILMNAGTGVATARLEFYSDSGAPLSLPIGGQLKAVHEVQLSVNGVTRFITDGTSLPIKVGWVKVTSAEPLGGSAIFQTVAGGRIISEAGVASSPLAAHFTAYVESIGYAESGLAICNPNPGEVGITLNLRDSAGNLAASTSFRLAPNGHIARFFSGTNQWFPAGFAEFEGTLEVLAAGGPVSAVALRYDNYEANVFATLPVIVIP